MKKQIYTYILSLFIASSSLAATPCNGNVQTLAFNPANGIVQASIGYGVWYLCSVSQTYNGIDTATCKMWYSTLMTAKISNKKINMIFDTTNSCNQIGNWANPNPMPYWVEVLEN